MEREDHHHHHMVAEQAWSVREKWASVRPRCSCKRSEHKQAGPLWAKARSAGSNKAEGEAVEIC